MKRLELKVLENGIIGGLNGVLLAVAAEAGLPGVGLLGEMPQMLAQVPMPKASHAILEAFTTLAGIELDFTDLVEHAKSVEQQLSDLISRATQQGSEEPSAEGDELTVAEEPEQAEPQAHRLRRNR